jgi:hypothetical protein
LLKYYKLPFIITLLTGILPWVVRFPFFGPLTWFPEIFCSLVFVYLLFSSRRSLTLNAVHLFIIYIFVYKLIIQGISGDGIGASAILSVLLTSALFLIFFKTGNEEQGVKKIIGQIGIIYSIHICFILFEVFLIYTNNVEILVILSNGWYKPGMPEYYTPVPQSIFKNSQAASQQCMFAASWFVMLYLSHKKLGIKFKMMYVALLIAAVTVFIFYPTTTIQAVGLIMLFSVVFLKPFSSRLLLRFLVPITILLISSEIYEKLIHKLRFDLNKSKATIIVDSFTDPFYLFFRIPLSDQLWGLGSMNSLKNAGLRHADLGMGIQILQIGSVLSVIVLIAFLLLVIKMFRKAYNKNCDKPHIFPWLWLGSANALLAVGNLLSLIHYSVSLQVGGRTLLSLHIALILLSLHKIASYSRTSH